MKVGAGPHGPGITVRWQRIGGVLWLGAGDDWAHVAPHKNGWRANHLGVMSHHQHRWQAKRWAECALGNHVRRSAEIRAMSGTALAHLRAVCRDGAVALAEFGKYLRKLA
jgi:hypothetical protein